MTSNRELFPLEPYIQRPRQSGKTRRTGTFTDNMKLPIHRWFRYSAGVSAEWVQSLLQEFEQPTLVLDPFVGSGTTLVAADSVRVASVGIEAHPFIAKLTKAKLLWAT